MLYTASVVGFFLLFVYLLFALRQYWIKFLPSPVSSRLRHYAPINTFDQAAQQGFSTGESSQLCALGLRTRLVGRDERAGGVRSEVRGEDDRQGQGQGQGRPAIAGRSRRKRERVRSLLTGLRY